jgi:predicted ATPase
VLVILEDAHWLDPTTLELIELVVGRVERLRVLLVVTCRPGFDPPWAGRAHVASLSLTRLVRDQATEVVGRVTGGRMLPPEVLRQILEKTDGVPLFVEELTNTRFSERADAVGDEEDASSG